MNIVCDKEIMVFTKETNVKKFYSLGMSKKKQDGTYENGYMLCAFKNGVDVDNQAKIKIKSAWLSFFKTKEGRTNPYVFINEFELCSVNDIPETKSQYQNTQVHLSDEDLPF